MHAVGFAVPALSPEAAVRSYRTFSPLPVPLDPGVPGLGAIGSLFSVALSLAPNPSGPVGVTHHRVLPCSDFPHARRSLDERAAATTRHGTTSRSDRCFGSATARPGILCVSTPVIEPEDAGPLVARA